MRGCIGPGSANESSRQTKEFYKVDLDQMARTNCNQRLVVQRHGLVFVPAYRPIDLDVRLLRQTFDFEPDFKFAARVYILNGHKKQYRYIREHKWWNAVHKANHEVSAPLLTSAICTQRQTNHYIPDSKL